MAPSPISSPDVPSSSRLCGRSSVKLKAVCGHGRSLSMLCLPWKRAWGRSGSSRGVFMKAIKAIVLLVGLMCCVGFVIWSCWETASSTQAVLGLKRLGARITFSDPATRNRASVNLARTGITDEDLLVLQAVKHVQELD